MSDECQTSKLVISDQDLHSLHFDRRLFEAQALADRVLAIPDRALKSRIAVRLGNLYLATIARAMQRRHAVRTVIPNLRDLIRRLIYQRHELGRLRSRLDQLDRPLVLFGGDRDDSLLKTHKRKDGSRAPVHKKTVRELQRLVQKSLETRLAVLTAASAESTHEMLIRHFPPSVRQRWYCVSNMGGLGQRPDRSPFRDEGRLTPELKGMISSFVTKIIAQNKKHLQDAGMQFHDIRIRDYSIIVHLKLGSPIQDYQTLARVLREALTASGHDDLQTLRVINDSKGVHISYADKPYGLEALVAELSRPEVTGLANDVIWKHMIIVGDADNDVSMLNQVATKGGIAIWLGDIPAPELGLDPRVIRLIRQGPAGARKAAAMYVKSLGHELRRTRGTDLDVMRGSGLADLWTAGAKRKPLTADTLVLAYGLWYFDFPILATLPVAIGLVVFNRLGPWVMMFIRDLFEIRLYPKEFRLPAEAA